MLTTVSEGFAIIRFVISKEFSKLSFSTEQLIEETWKNIPILSKYGAMTIPCDEAKYEIIASITFPKYGRYKVRITQTHQHESNQFEAIYFFDAINCQHRNYVSPFDYIFRGRKFAPVD
jgi:hypothetical protein